MFYGKTDRFSGHSGRHIFSQAEFTALYSTVMLVHDHFSVLYNVNPWEAAFELEFKIDGQERALFIKQVRPYFDSDG